LCGTTGTTGNIHPTGDFSSQAASSCEARRQLSELRLSDLKAITVFFLGGKRGGNKSENGHFFSDAEWIFRRFIDEYR
jgi:hypothetical protein